MELLEQLKELTQQGFPYFESWLEDRGEMYTDYLRGTGLYHSDVDGLVVGKTLNITDPATVLEYCLKLSKHLDRQVVCRPMGSQTVFYLGPSKKGESNEELVAKCTEFYKANEHMDIQNESKVSQVHKYRPMLRWTEDSLKEYTEWLRRNPRYSVNVVGKILGAGIHLLHDPRDVATSLSAHFKRDIQCRYVSEGLVFFLVPIEPEDSHELLQSEYLALAKQAMALQKSNNGDNLQKKRHLKVSGLAIITMALFAISRFFKRS